MTSRHLILLLLALFLSPVAQAQSAKRSLDEFFNGLRTLQGRFEQTITQNSRVIQRTQGALAVLRPGKFRWQYESPFEQLITTNGEMLWVYEPDLDQVTLSALDASVGNTPAILLSTDESLDKVFTIVDAGLKEGLNWAMLDPLSEQSTFRRIFLGFNAHGLMAMDIVDALDQTISIHFSELRRNVKLDPKLFEFEIPAGVDVIGGE
ncbi:MAG: outer membrane lipoprotein chaperone LolA [Chromatiales bacterium]|nr:outer membrane lipoprotein chaperone LolA [Chromatiales bacterium]